MPGAPRTAWIRFGGSRRLPLVDLVAQKRDELQRRGWPEKEFDYRACAASFTTAQLADYKARLLHEIDTGTSENVMAAVVQVSRTHIYRCGFLSSNGEPTDNRPGGESSALAQTSRRCPCLLWPRAH